MHQAASEISTSCIAGKFDVAISDDVFFDKGKTASVENLLLFSSALYTTYNNVTCMHETIINMIIKNRFI